MARRGQAARPSGRCLFSMKRLAGRLKVLALLVSYAAAVPLVGCAGGPGTAPALPADALSVPVTGADGALRQIPARLCLPVGAGAGAARLVVVNHGSPGEGALARARYSLLSCDHPVARHFLARGEAVLAPLRRGYGGDAGPWVEGFGPCGFPDYLRAARETARDIRAAVALARTLPGVSPEGVVLVGQSAGGWGMLALAADPPPGVSAVIAVAPGRGGRQNGRPDNNCRPDLLAEAAGRLAGEAGPGALPLLWLHTPNDSFFGPGLVAAMVAAHAGAGGRATVVQLPAFGQDGHDMFYSRAGAPAWAPTIDGWIDGHP